MSAVQLSILLQQKRTGFRLMLQSDVQKKNNYENACMEEMTDSQLNSVFLNEVKYHISK